MSIQESIRIVPKGDVAVVEFDLIGEKVNKLSTPVLTRFKEVVEELGQSSYKAAVLISRKPGGRRIAVIDGQIVRPGSKVGNAVVVEIQDTAVILRKGKSLETVKLYPSSKTERK